MLLSVHVPQFTSAHDRQLHCQYLTVTVLELQLQYVADLWLFSLLLITLYLTLHYSFLYSAWHDTAS